MSLNLKNWPALGSTTKFGSKRRWSGELHSFRRVRPNGSVTRLLKTVQIQWFRRDDRPHVGDRSRREIVAKAMGAVEDEPDAEVKAELFHPHEGGDGTVRKVVREAIFGHPHPASSVNADKSGGAEPIRYSFRSFDRQWIIPDNRLINRANPKLWKTASGSEST